MSKIQQQWKELPTPAKIGIYAVGAYFLYKIVKNIKNRPTIAPLPTGGSGIPAVGYDQSGSPVPWSRLGRGASEAQVGGFATSWCGGRSCMGSCKDRQGEPGGGTACGRDVVGWLQMYVDAAGFRGGAFPT